MYVNLPPCQNLNRPGLIKENSSETWLIFRLWVVWWSDLASAHGQYTPDIVQGTCNNEQLKMMVIGETLC